MAVKQKLILHCNASLVASVRQTIAATVSNPKVSPFLIHFTYYVKARHFCHYNKLVYCYKNKLMNTFYKSRKNPKEKRRPILWTWEKCVYLLSNEWFYRDLRGGNASHDDCNAYCHVFKILYKRLYFSGWNIVVTEMCCCSYAWQKLHLSLQLFLPGDLFTAAAVWLRQQSPLFLEALSLSTWIWLFSSTEPKDFDRFPNRTWVKWVGVPLGVGLWQRKLLR